MKTRLILQAISGLAERLRYPAELDVFPHDPRGYGAVHSDFTVATLLREIGGNLHNREFAARLYEIGKELVSASPSIAALWDDVYLSSLLLNHCWPQWWWPYVHLASPHDNPGVGPRPEPWQDGNTITWIIPIPWRYEVEFWLEHTTPAMNDILLAHALRQLAGLISSEKTSNAIRQTGEAIMESASGRLFDEYCATPVKHSGPVPRSQAIPA